MFQRMSTFKLNPMSLMLAKQGLVTIALSLMVSGVCAQESPASSQQSAIANNVADVVKTAIEYNPQVKAAWNELQAAEHDVDVARGNYLPSIDATAGVGRADREVDGVGSYSTSFAELTLNQMIWDGFATRNEVERLDRAKLVSYYELLGASENVALEAVQAYLDVERYRELVRLAQENYRQHQRVYQQIEERVQNGAGRGVDLEQITGRLALAESNLMTEASNLHDVSARYLRIVGQLPTDSLAPMPGFEDDLPPSVTEAVNLAFEGNPEFHAAIENIEASRAQQDATRAAFQPRLDLQGRTGTYDNTDSTPIPRGSQDRHSIELVASMNLYRGGSDMASFRAAGDRIEQAVNQRENVCHNIRQTTQIAFNDSRQLREQLNYINQHRLSSDRVRSAYQQQFDIGERTLLDVLDSENEYFEASRAYVNAKHNVLEADARTLASMGQLMLTLDVVREGTPTLNELGSNGVSINPDAICPATHLATPSLAELTNSYGNTQAPASTPDMVLSADALFTTGSAELNSGAHAELSSFAQKIHQMPSVNQVVVSGHTDSSGTNALNASLSEQRALNVAEYLIEQGIDPNIVQVRGYGSRQPVASNATVDGRRENRRVEITLDISNS
ncbi:TolC family outer membrane protein [Halomonas sp. N3-2A]|uniref:TolC family outer membrane protein n=1 Tax=Halomonas sp. N3-2A TaxID=2014541 RepID=UPI001E44A4C9|nr:TolC family outer membrane protein [Halomonas sp. N3-2A]